MSQSWIKMEVKSSIPKINPLWPELIRIIGLQCYFYRPPSVVIKSREYMHDNDYMLEYEIPPICGKFGIHSHDQCIH